MSKGSMIAIVSAFILSIIAIYVILQQPQKLPKCDDVVYQQMLNEIAKRRGLEIVSMGNFTTISQDNDETICRCHVTTSDGYSDFYHLQVGHLQNSDKLYMKVL